MADKEKKSLKNQEKSLEKNLQEAKFEVSGEKIEVSTSSDQIKTTTKAHENKIKSSEKKSAATKESKVNGVDIAKDSAKKIVTLKAINSDSDFEKKQKNATLNAKIKFSTAVNDQDSLEMFEKQELGEKSNVVKGKKSGRVMGLMDTSVGANVAKKEEECLMVVKKLIQAIEDGKMLDIKCYRGKNDYLVDFVIVATGTSDRHVSVLAEKIVHLCKHQLGILVSGDRASGAWSVVDTGFAIVHLMTIAKRDYFRIDELMLELGNIHFEQK